MTTQLDRIENALNKLIRLMTSEREIVEEKKLFSEVVIALRTMTLKQHAALQMLLAGASNEEIADRFGVSVNTAKVYVRSIAAKLGVNARTQIVIKAMPALDAMSDDEYVSLSKGLPRDWNASYDYEDRTDDPFWTSYTGARVKRR